MYGRASLPAPLEGSISSKEERRRREGRAETPAHTIDLHPSAEIRGSSLTRLRQSLSDNTVADENEPNSILIALIRRLVNHSSFNLTNRGRFNESPRVLNGRHGENAMT